MDEAKLEQYYVGGRVYIYRMGANFRYINLAPEPSVEMFVGSNILALMPYPPIVKYWCVGVYPSFKCEILHPTNNFPLYSI